MKLYMFMLAFSALAWHHGAYAQECSCDCTCPATVSTCSPDETTTEILPTTTKPATTTTFTTTTTITTTPKPTTTTTAIPTTTTTPEPTTTTTAVPTTTTTPKPTTTTTAIPTTTPIPPYECGTYTIEEGKQVPLLSPNYPDKYGKKDSCTWELTCDNANGVISVSCNDFKTEAPESGEECKDADFVRIKDGTGDNLGDFCDKTGPDLTTSDNYMKIKFSTDGDKNKKTGFSCTAMCSVPTTTEKPTTTTTDPANGWSGQCTGDWTATDTETKIWQSPDYDGTTHYPEGDYCCWFNVTIPSTYDMFMVTMVMGSNAKIYETSQCTGDKILYYRSAGDTSTLCGDLGGQTWTEMAVNDTPLSFGFQWCSDTTDGGTDIGFQMTFTGKNLNP